MKHQIVNGSPRQIEPKLITRGNNGKGLPEENRPAAVPDCKKVEGWERYFYRLHLAVQESETLERPHECFRTQTIERPLEPNRENTNKKP